MKKKVSQAMILAAGEGRRMRPLTLDTPKPLLVVGGKPLIVWHIERLKTLGIKKIVVNARYLADRLVDFFEHYQFGVDIRLSLEDGFDAPIETAGGIKLALERELLDDAPFLLINGDVWTDYDCRALAMTELGAMLGCLGLVTNPDHHPTGDFAIAGDRLSLAGEKLTFSGLSLLSPRLVDGVAVGTHAPLAPVLKAAALNQELLAKHLTALTWVDVGTPERLSYLDQWLKKSQQKS